MQRRSVQAVGENEAGRFLLFLDYDDATHEAADAYGHIFQDLGRRAAGRPPQGVLATSDSLRALWASPSGALWVASADGNVATNAAVSFAQPARSADYKTVSGPPWHATALPLVRPKGLPPNVDLIWGIDDGCVLAAAVGGHIFQWDGRHWHHVHQAAADIRAFGATSAQDIYAAGVRGTLLRYDGRVWSSVSLPPPAADRENLTGVSVAPDGNLFIASALGSDEGRLLHGSAAGFVEVARCPFPLVAMAAVGDRLLFATGKGVAEFMHGKITVIKSSFATAAIFSGRARAFVLEPAPPRAAYIEYDPMEHQAPWVKFEF